MKYLVGQNMVSKKDTTIQAWKKKNLPLQLHDKKSINKTSRGDIDFCGVGSRKMVEKTQVVSVPGEIIELNFRTFKFFPLCRKMAKYP